LDTKDTYITITKPSPEVLHKDRNSKFYGYAFPVTSEYDIKTCLNTLKKRHYQAGHFCYAWRLGMRYDSYRYSDDGEPSNSAGAPIYGQIQSFDLTNVFVVVVRYFGGTKLGVGGLIQAYRTTAQEVLTASECIEKTIDDIVTIQFDYPLLSKVMRIIKDHNLTIVYQKQELHCEYQLAIRQKESSRITSLFEEIYGITIIP